MRLTTSATAACAIGVRPPVIPPITLPHATPARVVDRATMMWETTVPNKQQTTTGLRPTTSDMLPVITQPWRSARGATHGGKQKEREQNKTTDRSTIQSRTTLFYYAHINKQHTSAGVNVK